MKYLIAIVVGMAVTLVPLAASAASPTEKFQPNTPYYFEHFDPVMKPWDPGQDLNIEEVFKNYVYYEVIFDKTGREVIVNRYIQNRKERSDRYLIRTDGALEPK